MEPSENSKFSGNFSGLDVLIRLKSLNIKSEIWRRFLHTYATGMKAFVKITKKANTCSQSTMSKTYGQNSSDFYVNFKQVFFGCKHCFLLTFDQIMHI